MRPQHQTKFGAEEGNWGNCFATCVAIILDLHVDDIPNFCTGDENTWFRRFQGWLNDRGMAAITWNTVGAPVPKDVPFIASGPGPRGVQHSIVMFEGSDGVTVTFDPHPSGDGLLKIEEREYLVRFPGWRSVISVVSTGTAQKRKENK